MTWPVLGSLSAVPALDRPDLLADPVAQALKAIDPADVNGLVRRRLDARKASSAPMDDAVAITGMDYGGITPIGLPENWPVLVDAAVAAAPAVVIGSGVRHSKLALPARSRPACPASR